MQCILKEYMTGGFFAFENEFWFGFLVFLISRIHGSYRAWFVLPLSTLYKFYVVFFFFYFKLTFTRVWQTNAMFTILIFIPKVWSCSTQKITLKCLINVFIHYYIFKNPPLADIYFLLSIFLCAQNLDGSFIF